MIRINGTLMHYARTICPSAESSGVSAYHGVEGFRALSHAKASFSKAAGTAAIWFARPSDDWPKTALNFILR